MIAMVMKPLLKVQKRDKTTTIMKIEAKSLDTRQNNNGYQTAAKSPETGQHSDAGSSLLLFSIFPNRHYIFEKNIFFN